MGLGDRNRLRTLIALALLSAPLSGCDDKKPAPPKGQRAERVGYGSTSSLCLLDLMSSLSTNVFTLSFNRYCTEDSAAGGFIWAYRYQKTNHDNTSSPAASQADCVDSLVSDLNANISGLEIPLNERCTKKGMMLNTERYIWVYDLTSDH